MLLSSDSSQKQKSVLQVQSHASYGETSNRRSGKLGVNCESSRGLLTNHRHKLEIQDKKCSSK